ncbi:MAG: Mur ligase domain-containing protein [Candidatus Fibromonas sp.]|jgi:UDP-N-acetylmuramate--alanine ligase|nr:Mur ligase domain-containing protein [Candidatus Fibromonas sp.]
MPKRLPGIFFIGVAGVGMSALAQFLAGKGVRASGSDRRFANSEGEKIKKQLQEAGVKCFLQDGSGINENLSAVVVSTAIEAGNPDTEAAQKLNIPVMHRSELLAKITLENQTIAVSGTSGKSTVTGLIWHILNECKKEPSLLSGAGLGILEEQGKIGNAVAGNGWLVAEADESDGTLVRYSPKIGVVLNIDKDHKEISELENLFGEFAGNVRKAGGILIVNGSHPLAAKLADSKTMLFGWGENCTVKGSGYAAKGIASEFKVFCNGKSADFHLPLPGKHNAENALAAVAACISTGVSLKECAAALKSWKGIHRRSQIYECKSGIILVDDYAHNPAKIAASIRSCQDFAKGRVFAWFQPHGFGPTKFLKDDLTREISQVLRPGDEMWFSSIYYAGGTADRSFDSDILSNALREKGCNANFIPDREECLKKIAGMAKPGDVVLLMGARDPSLAEFAKGVFAIFNTLQC